MWRLYAFATPHPRFPAGFQKLHDQFVNRFGPADGVEDGLTGEMVATAVGFGPSKPACPTTPWPTNLWR
jgi:hypothetical protein